MMDFYVSSFTLDANFEMGPRWSFSTDGQFLIVSRELVFIFVKITYT